MNYIITYDLEVADNYQSLIETIKWLSKKVMHIQESVWIIESDDSAEGIFNLLRSYIDTKDKLFVAEITENKREFPVRLIVPNLKKQANIIKPLSRSNIVKPSFNLFDFSSLK